MKCKKDLKLQSQSQAKEHRHKPQKEDGQTHIGAGSLRKVITGQHD